MNKYGIATMLALMAVWMLLMEEFSWQNAAVGMFIGMLAMRFTRKFLRLEKIRRISFHKMALFPIFMVGRIYMDALFLMRLLFSAHKWGLVTHKLEVKNESLRYILSQAITLTPGNIFVEQNGDDITVLCVGCGKQHGFAVSKAGVRGIEKFLLKAQRK